MKKKVVSISEKNLSIIDEILSQSECENLTKAFEEIGYERCFVSRSDSKGAQWGIEFDPHAITCHSLFMKIFKGIKKIHLADDLFLRRSYCRLGFYGEINYPHKDNNSSNQMPGKNDYYTCVVFLNSKWCSDWGGELIFYNDELDAEIAVSPKVGRIVFFDANLWHLGGVPTKDCHTGRLTLILRFTKIL